MKFNFYKDDVLNLGPTGTYPNGKLNKDDQGGIRFAVGNKDGNVVVDFNHPVAWLAMPPELAKSLARALMDHAERAEK